jgi:hypothetical protein
MTPQKSRIRRITSQFPHRRGQFMNTSGGLLYVWPANSWNANVDPHKITPNKLLSASNCSLTSISGNNAVAHSLCYLKLITAASVAGSLDIQATWSSALQRFPPVMHLAKSWSSPFSVSEIKRTLEYVSGMMIATSFPAFERQLSSPTMGCVREEVRQSQGGN